MLNNYSNKIKILLTSLTFLIFSQLNGQTPLATRPILVGSPIKSLLPADVYFLSYPRSGKNLTTSYLQALTNKPI